MIRFKIPATSANLGPGFDCLGIAFTLSNKYKIEKAKKMLIEGCDEKFTKSDNVFNRAFLATMKVLKKKGSYHVHYEPTIPTSRGLGSSASVIVAGCMTANLLYGGKRKLSKDKIFQIASRIEGHPDNVAPAIYGGLTASTKLDDGTFYTSKFTVSSKLHFTALIPDFTISTEKARKILPKVYKKSDAVSTISHSILMTKALQSGDFNLLKNAKVDFIHEPYRKKLIKDYEYIKKKIEKDGDAILLISGSGPTLLVISKDSNFYKKINLKNTKAKWEVRKLEIKK